MSSMSDVDFAVSQIIALTTEPEPLTVAEHAALVRVSQWGFRYRAAEAGRDAWPVTEATLSDVLWLIERGILTTLPEAPGNVVLTEDGAARALLASLEDQPAAQPDQRPPAYGDIISFRHTTLGPVRGCVVRYVSGVMLVDVETHGRMYIRAGDLADTAIHIETHQS